MNKTKNFVICCFEAKKNEEEKNDERVRCSTLFKWQNTKSLNAV